MAEQFADDYMETVAMEPEVDVESAHLVTHAKVYAIAEKYVPPFVTFCLYTFCLIMRPGLPDSFHLRLHIFSLRPRCTARREQRR